MVSRSGENLSDIETLNILLTAEDVDSSGTPLDLSALGVARPVSLEELDALGMLKFLTRHRDKVVFEFTPDTRKRWSLKVGNTGKIKWRTYASRVDDRKTPEPASAITNPSENVFKSMDRADKFRAAAFLLFGAAMAPLAAYIDRDARHTRHLLSGTRPVPRETLLAMIEGLRERKKNLEQASKTRSAYPKKQLLALAYLVRPDRPQKWIHTELGATLYYAYRITQAPDQEEDPSSPIGKVVIQARDSALRAAARNILEIGHLLEAIGDGE